MGTSGLDCIYLPFDNYTYIKMGKKEVKLREWMLFLGGVILVVTFLGAILGLNTQPASYLLVDPTREQIIEVYTGDVGNRVWFSTAHYVVGGSSLVEVEFKTRLYERDHVEKFLDSLGVEYKRFK